MPVVNYQKQFSEAYKSGRQRGLDRRKRQIQEYSTEEVPTEDTFATKKQLNKQKYADTLANDQYFMEEGIKLQESLLSLQGKQQEVEDERQILQLKSTKRAMTIAREDLQAGIKFAQESGLDVADASIDEEGNFNTVDDKGNKASTNYDDVIEALTSAETIFQAKTALASAERKKRNKSSLKTNEYLKPDGNKININGIKTAYKMKFDLADEVELLMLKGTDPERWAVEKAKIKAAPDFENWTLDFMGIDLMGTKREPEIDPLILAKLRDKYKGVPIETLKKAYLAKQKKLKKGE